MNVRWLAISLLLLTTFALAGCAGSRYGRRNYPYGPYGNSPGVYGTYDPRVYGPPSRDYRWEQRRMEELRRRQREEMRRERYRNRDRRHEHRHNR